MSRPGWAWAALAVGLLAGASACEEPASGPPTALLTLSSLRAAYEADPDRPLGAGLSTVFTGGFPASYFLSAADRVRVAPAYTQGQQTAYMTTDLWVNFPVVWLQPLYIFVSAWDDKAPAQNVLELPWLVTVSDRSAFWSPFQRVYYVVVPRDTAPGSFRTVRSILDANLPVFPGPARLLTLAPAAGIEPEDPSAAASPILLPELRAAGKVGRARTRTVWVEGQGERQALDFGDNRFEWNERYEIIDQPLFFFFTKTADGTWVPLTNVPRVGGTGPLFENRPTMAPGNRPRFGSIWRLWAARLPASARLFVPPERREEWEARNRGGGWATLPLAEIPPVTGTTSPADLDRHAYKVLLDGTCLARPSLTLDELAACPWLDSQSQLERLLPAALLPSEILVACPFVAYGGAPVPTPPEP